jgi:DNA helicase-2/ATP-dependent DNA helicase PcrA
MQGFDWSNPDPAGPRLRTDKTICANPWQHYEVYPAVATMTARDIQDEAEQFADLVVLLKEQGKIADYSDVALLLHSVRSDGEVYRQALARRNIPVSCPRGRRFFQQTEILLIIGALARIPGYHPGEDAPERDENFVRTLDLCWQMLWEQCRCVGALEEEFQLIDEHLHRAGEENECNLADYFYRLIFLPPFTDFLCQKRKQANLVLFSGLLRTFQKHFAYPRITVLHLASVKADFLDRFLAFLHMEGLNEEEEQHQPLFQGHVQMMTIYQAKGLEFPVVVVGRLDNPPWRASRDRKDLQGYYHRVQYEPEDRIAGCDLRRLYSVAFSRPRRLLILSAPRQAHTHLLPIWQAVPQFTYLHDSLLAMPALSTARTTSHPRPRYGFTSHYQTYRLCPRRYHFFVVQRFVPSRTRNAFPGQLVHQAIERLHYVVLEKRGEQFDEAQLWALFQKIAAIAQRTHQRSLSEAEQEQAYTHVLNYYRHNQHRLSALRHAEYSVQIEHAEYVVSGKIDALIEDAAGLEILDFKTTARCSADSPRLSLYQQQLYFYASALSRKEHPAALPRLALYWTAEEQLADSLMEVP